MRAVKVASMKHVVIFVAVALMFAAAFVASARTEEECHQLGFNRAEVKCHHCPSLLEHTGSAELEQECLSCCAADDQMPRRTYARARIEQMGISYLIEETRGELGMFYKRFKDKFGNRVRFVEARLFYGPRLVLEDDNGGEELEMNIMGWTKDTLHDYLVQALGMAPRKEEP
ncbi:hypothetical protein TraAM80_05026 [Trypanosoma rangeli]|uniref:Selenoprotein F/M domain-containing protein n=1 Tax=Trypanosoma rangeli TaxID=5698 RepID=A0A3R7KEH5_TRYRA|nr:uncharacterized protein TraAM80_05026 [Trypanosoma rangeli]RNF04888.1 hypothetical protein TraAM80_05026 [Trypanosoma rangeli]|eukprot:RNF04888.1 hypothetical protein TraAM80_05026 [Trypanosoma rangeli]